MDLGSLSLCNTLPACKNLPVFMTYFSLKMVQSSCSRRKTVVGPVRAAVAGWAAGGNPALQAVLAPWQQGLV